MPKMVVTNADMATLKRTLTDAEMAIFERLLDRPAKKKRDHEAEMAELERAFNAGKKRAWLDAIYVCVCSWPEKPVPMWAKLELLRAYSAVASLDVRSWDDVLGKPHRGRKTGQIKYNRSIQQELFWRLHQLREMKPKPRDPLSVVAQEFGISKAAAKRLFECEAKNGGTAKQRLAAAEESKIAFMALAALRGTLVRKTP